MTVTSDFWLALHELGSALEPTVQDGAGDPTFDSLQDEFERLPRPTQNVLRRELQVVIVALARLDAHLSLDSLSDTCLGR